MNLLEESQESLVKEAVRLGIDKIHTDIKQFSRSDLIEAIAKKWVADPELSKAFEKVQPKPEVIEKVINEVPIKIEAQPVTSDKTDKNVTEIMIKKVEFTGGAIGQAKFKKLDDETWLLQETNDRLNWLFNPIREWDKPYDPENRDLKRTIINETPRSQEWIERWFRNRRHETEYVHVETR